MDEMDPKTLDRVRRSARRDRANQLC